MKQEFYVQVLDDKEWSELPYKGIEDSLGFADPKKGMAFVRKTGIPEMDYGTLVHEVNHLIEKHGKEHPDWEDGILHKSGGSLGKILGPVVGTIAGLVTANPLIGAAIGGAISGGTQAHTQSSKPEKYDAPSIGSIGGSALMGGLGAYGGAKLISGGIAGGSAAGPGFFSKAAGIGKGALLGTSGVTGIGTGGSAAGSAPAGVGTYTPPTGGLLGSGGKFLGMGASGNPNTFSSSAITPLSGAVKPAAGLTGTVTPITGASGAGTAASNAGKAFSFKDLITPQTILGGTALLGSMAAPQPQFEMPPGVEDLRSKLNAGGAVSPLGIQAQGALKDILGSTPSQLNAPANDAYYAETFRQIDQQYDTAKKQLDAAYNNAGQLGSGEYFAELNKLTQAQANAKNDFVAKENQRRFEFGSNQKYQAIQTALGVDDKVMQELAGLTGLEVQAAAIKYGANAADVTAIRQALGTLGGNLLMSGMGASSPSNLTLKLG